MIELRQVANGVILPIKAYPGAKRNMIAGEHNGALKVRITAAPERGKANEAIVKLLADRLRLRRADISLVRGAASAKKAFCIAGLARDQLAGRVAAVLLAAQNR